MTLTIVLLAVCSFVGFLFLFFFMLPRSSAQSELLEEVSREMRASRQSQSQSSVTNADVLAQPFTFIRSFFSKEPDPALVRRLMLAGYRKPAHADIFLGVRLILPVVAGLLVAFLISENTIFFF